MIQTSELEAYLAPAEAARRLGISVEQLRVLMRTNRIRCLRTPLGRLVPEAEVTRIAAERATLHRKGVKER